MNWIFCGHVWKDSIFYFFCWHSYGYFFLSIEVIKKKWVVNMWIFQINPPLIFGIFIFMNQRFYNTTNSKQFMNTDNLSPQHRAGVPFCSLLPPYTGLLQLRTLWAAIITFKYLMQSHAMVAPWTHSFPRVLDKSQK